MEKKKIMRQTKTSEYNQQVHSSQIAYREEVIHADLTNIRKIVASHSLFSRDEVELAVELVHERLVKGIKSGYQFLFAEQTGRILGYSCFGLIPCTLGSYDLYWIAVDRNLQNMGIGTELLKQTEHIIMKQGARIIYIETSSRTEYRSTQLFYEKCGYRVEAVLKDFYSPGDDKMIFTKFMLNQT
jgi:D-alanine-D-alanine ligase